MDPLVIFIAQYFYLFVLAFAALFFFLQPRHIQKSMVICGVIVAPLAFVISRIASRLYYDPRPFVVGHFVPLFAHAADNGFPSDHVLLTGAIAMIIFFYNKKWSVPFWALAVLIGWARVASGVHHTVDIAGSIVIVLVSGAVYYFALGRKRGRSLPSSSSTRLP